MTALEIPHKTVLGFLRNLVILILPLIEVANLNLAIILVKSILEFLAKILLIVSVILIISFIILFLFLLLIFIIKISLLMVNQLLTKFLPIGFIKLLRKFEGL